MFTPQEIVQLEMVLSFPTRYRNLDQRCYNAIISIQAGGGTLPTPIQAGNDGIIAVTGNVVTFTAESMNIGYWEPISSAISNTIFIEDTNPGNNGLFTITDITVLGAYIQYWNPKATASTGIKYSQVDPSVENQVRGYLQEAMALDSTIKTVNNLTMANKVGDLDVDYHAQLFEYRKRGKEIIQRMSIAMSIEFRDNFFNPSGKKIMVGSGGIY